VFLHHISHWNLPPFDVYCELVIPALRAIEAALELVRDHPSIHWDGGTSHVRRICRSDKGDHMSDLLGCCELYLSYLEPCRLGMAKTQPKPLGLAQITSLDGQDSCW
jgi:hypothetical protein